MCGTSLITVTDKQMLYLATNVRQNLGFHHPVDDRAAFEGVWLRPKTRSSSHFLGKMVIFFHILKRNIWKVCALPPKFSAEWRPSKWQKRVKKSSKEATKLAFFGIFGGVFSKRDLGQNFFLVLWPIRSIETIIGMKKKVLKFLWKCLFFLMNLSKKLTVCSKWLWNPSKWCQ